MTSHVPGGGRAATASAVKFWGGMNGIEDPSNVDEDCPA